MKNKPNKSKVIVAGTTILLTIAIACLLFNYNNNRSLKRGLNDSKLKSELLLSEKLSMDKRNAILTKQMHVLLGKLGELKTSLADKSKMLFEKEKELKSYAWNNLKTKQLENELKSLQVFNGNLEKQIEELNSVLTRLIAENESSLNEIQTLREQNQNLSENNKLLLAMNANNYRIDATRGKKNKLTAIAKRTKKIVMGFDIPENIVEKIQFNITTPEGRTYSSEKDGLSYFVIETDKHLVASISSLNENIEITKRIEMTYKPDKKLSSGIYKIDIYNNGSYMGSCQVKLR
ncbi:MAG: hypothetical protein ABIJ97_10920 [Bacteroidota bacterium]